MTSIARPAGGLRRMARRGERPATTPAGTAPGARHLLRLGLFNLAGLSLVAAAWGEGWLGAMLAADTTRLTLLIAAIFGLGLWQTAARAIELAGDLDEAVAPRPAAHGRAGAFLGAMRGRDAGSRAIGVSRLRAEIAARIAPVRHVAGALVILGLIGTVTGFIMALSGVSAARAADVGAVAAMISRLIEGMSVALYTTLEGAVLSLWLTVNHQLLAGAGAELLGRLVARGERDAAA